jgi:cytochrome c1
MSQVLILWRKEFMRKLFIVFVFFCSLHTVAQDTAKKKNDTNSFSDFSLVHDSLKKAQEESIFKETMEQNSRNLNDFLKYQEEQKARQKRNALIRISIGVFFFIILLVGLNRQRKKRQ